MKVDFASVDTLPSFVSERIARVEAVHSLTVLPND